MFQKTETLKMLPIFQEAICNASKTKNKSALEKFIVSYNAFATFTSIEHMEISCEAKNKYLIMFTLKHFIY